MAYLQPYPSAGQHMPGLMGVGPPPMYQSHSPFAALGASFIDPGQAMMYPPGPRLPPFSAQPAAPLLFAPQPPFLYTAPPTFGPAPSVGMGNMFLTPPAMQQQGYPRPAMQQQPNVSPSGCTKSVDYHQLRARAHASSLQFTDGGMAPADYKDPHGRRMFAQSNQSQLVAGGMGALAPGQGAVTSEPGARRAWYNARMPDHLVAGLSGLTVDGPMPPRPSGVHQPPQLVQNEYGLVNMVPDRARPYAFREQQGRMMGSVLQPSPTGFAALPPAQQLASKRPGVGYNAQSHIGFEQGSLAPGQSANVPNHQQRAANAAQGRVTSIQQTAGGITAPELPPQRGQARNNGAWITTHDSAYN